MPRIPRSNQQSTANGTPLPHSTGDGYAAVGRATQGLGQSIASAGKSIAGAFEGMQNEQEQHEMFKAKLDLTKFQGEQSVYQNDYDANIQGDGAGHVEQRQASYDNRFQGLRDKYANAPEKVRQFVELGGANLRNGYVQKSAATAGRQKGIYYATSTQQLLDTQILPKVTGDPDSLRASLAASETVISGIPSQDIKLTTQLRESAADSIYKTWREKAGPDAYEIGKGIAEEYQKTIGEAAAKAVDVKDLDQSAFPDYRDRIDDKRVPASIRHNNPGAQYPGPSARKFGTTGTKVIGGGHKIAVFPTAVHGAAAQFDLMNRAYTGKTLKTAIAKWSGGNSVGTYLKVIERETGIKANTVLTKEMVQDPKVAVAIAKAMSVQEAGRSYPMTDEQWAAGHAMAFGGKIIAAPPATVQARFASLVATDLPSLQKFSEAAAQRAEYEEAQFVNDTRQEVDKEMTNLALEGQLTPEMVKTYEPLLSASRYAQLRRLASPNNTKSSDARIYTGLLERVESDPDGVLTDAEAAYADKQISSSDYKEIYSKALREKDVEAKRPPWVAVNKSLVRSQLRPPSDATIEQITEYQDALKAYDQYVDEQADVLDRDKLQKFTTGLIQQTRAKRGAERIKALSMPRFSQVGREAMTMQEIEDAKERTRQALLGGKLTREEAILEAKKLRQWTETLTDKAVGAGKEVQPVKVQPKQQVGPAGALGGLPEAAAQMLGSGAAIGGTQVKGNSEVAPATVETFPEPQNLSEAAQAMIDSGATIPELIQRGFMVPGGIMSDGSFNRMVMPEILNTPISAIQSMLKPGYDYSNTEQAARDSFDAAGLITTGGLAGAGLKPAGAIGMGGGGVAKGAARQVDNLGFYSKLDEVLAGFGAKDQVTAKALQERGVKAAELEARGLSDLLAQGPQSAEALKGAAGEAVGLRKVDYSGYETTEVSYNPETFEGRRTFTLRNAQPGSSGPSRWQSYSLDPGNPTYRETVLHLPKKGDGDYRTGHWSEPNIIAHARTSMNTDAQGRKVMLVDELQSDWGQGLRDAGGPFNAEKVAAIKTRFITARDELRELEKQFADMPSQEKFEKANYGLLAKVPFFQGAPRDSKLSKNSQALYDLIRDKATEVDRLAAEHDVAASRTPANPLVNTSDQWQTTAMRQLIKQAVDEGADVIAIPSGKTVKSFKMGGKEDGIKYAYDKMYVKNMRNILSKMDKSITPERAEKLITPNKGAAGDGFMLFPITDKVRQAVKEGQPLFTQGTPAANAISAEDKKKRGE